MERSTPETAQTETPQTATPETETPQSETPEAAGRSIPDGSTRGRSEQVLLTALQVVGPELARRLGDLARRTEVPKGELLRQAVAEYLDRREQPTLPSLVGAFAGGIPSGVVGRPSRRTHAFPGGDAA